jgi:phosphoadenosine phosphosulfate reductase
MVMSLADKEEYSRKIILEAHEKYGENNAIAFSGGKDSTTLLHLVRSAFGGKMPWKIFTVDTGAEFMEIADFIRTIEHEWSLKAITLKNEDAIKNAELAKDKTACCYHRKAVPINVAIDQYGLKALMTAVRWDEQEARMNEQFFTQRDNPPHVRVQPVLHFKEVDIWSYIKKHNLPYCELYRKGYRSIDCVPCTKPHGPGGAERGGRDKNKEEAMKRLRGMGYF